MKTFTRIVGILFITFLVACGGDTTNEQNNNQLATIEDLTPPEETNENSVIDYQALADAYCKCSEHTVEINDKMKRLMEMTVPDNAELEKLYPKVDRAFKKAIECSREAKEKQTSGEISNKLLVKPMKQTCPDLPSSLVMKLLVTDIK